MTRLAPLLLLTAALALGGATLATAQPAEDTAPAAAPLTLDDILEQAAQAEAGAEEPEDEAETRGLPAAPIPYGALLTADDLDRRIRGASAAAQTLQGPLDGRWSVAAQDGAPLYTFLFVDSGRAGASLEGAWRDLTRGAGLTATGVIDDVQRNGGALNASFYPRSGQSRVSLTLAQMSDGNWSGEMVEGADRRTIRMIRDEPILDVPPMFGIAGVVSPYRTATTRPAPPPRRATPTKARKGKAVRGKAAKGKAAKGKRAPAKRTTRKKR